MEDGTLPRFSLAWMKLGMMQNGLCLTQKISQHQEDRSPKIENEYSLLDILEDNVPEKYFLSQNIINRIVLKT